MCFVYSDAHILVAEGYIENVAVTVRKVAIFLQVQLYELTVLIMKSDVHGQIYKVRCTESNVQSQVDTLRAISTLGCVCCMISIFTGSSFTAIDLMTSNLLGLPMFSFDLPNRDKLRFKRKRVYSIVLLEK